MSSPLSALEINRLIAPDLVMPELLQSYALCLQAAIAVILVIVAIRMCLRYGNVSPLLCLISSGITCFALEALVCFLGHATHAQIGQTTLYTAYGREVPLHLLFTYTDYFGIALLSLYPNMYEGKLTANGFWKGFGICVVLAYLFEIIPVSQGLWRYFGYQPLAFWKDIMMPLPWAVLNAFCVFFTVFAVDKVLPLMRGWKQVIVLVVVPISAVMGHVGGGAPFYWTMNAGLDQTGINIGGVMMMALCLLGIWLLGQLGYKQRKPVHVNENGFLSPQQAGAS